MPSSSVASAAVDIVATPARVWELLVDVEQWPDWTPTVTNVQRLDPGPLAIGSRTRIHQPRLRPTIWEVTELNEASGTFIWITRNPGIKITGAHIVSGTPLGCHATLSIKFSGLFASIARLMMGKLTREYVHTEAESLKLRSESWKKPRNEGEGQQRSR